MRDREAVRNTAKEIAQRLRDLAEGMPRPYDEDRRYSDREKDALEANIETVLSAAQMLTLSEPESRPDPIADLCEKIKQDIRYCDHGYIHITCGQCVATWLRG